MVRGVASPSMNWDSFVDLAKELAGRDEEGAKRSAISRAYYGLYHHARDWYNENGSGWNRSEKEHINLWKCVAAQGGELAKAAQIGQQLRDQRNEADYDDRITSFRLPFTAQQAPQLAASAIEKIRSFEPEN